jgi:hypothetical protein
MPFSPETLVTCLSCGVFNIKDFSGALIASKLYLLAFAVYFLHLKALYFQTGFSQEHRGRYDIKE